MRQAEGPPQAQNPVERQQGDQSEPKRSEVQKSCMNAGDSPPSENAETPATMQEGDANGPASEPRSGKQNDKQNDKRVLADPDLAGVIDAWPELPEATKTAIVAVVEAASEPKGETARKPRE